MREKCKSCSTEYDSNLLFRGYCLNCMPEAFRYWKDWWKWGW